MKAFYENRLGDIVCRNDPKAILQCSSHLHYNIEIAIVYEGKIEVNVDDLPAQEANAGDIILVFPNQIHSFTTLQKDSNILFIVHPSLFTEYSSLFSDSIPDGNVVKGAFKNSEIRALTQSICKIYDTEDGQYKRSALKGYFLAFLSKLFSLAKFKEAKQTSHMQAIGAVMNYCAANYEKNLSLDILEEELHINKYYISHLVNKKLKMNFNDYVNSIRISNACRYIDEGDKTVSEISDIVGFNTVRTFNRAFLKHVGVSPREYKNKEIG